MAALTIDELCKCLRDKWFPEFSKWLDEILEVLRKRDSCLVAGLCAKEGDCMEREEWVQGTPVCDAVKECFTKNPCDLPDDHIKKPGFARDEKGAAFGYCAEDPGKFCESMQELSEKLDQWLTWEFSRLDMRDDCLAVGLCLLAHQSACADDLKTKRGDLCEDLRVCLTLARGKGITGQPFPILKCKAESADTLCTELQEHWSAVGAWVMARTAISQARDKCVLEAYCEIVDQENCDGATECIEGNVIPDQPQWPCCG